MNSTGLKGTLDDAYTLAEKLYMELQDAHGIAADARLATATVLETAHLLATANDLSLRISNLILQLRS